VNGNITAQSELLLDGLIAGQGMFIAGSFDALFFLRIQRKCAELS
jgi:hypothetical protein